MVQAKLTDYDLSKMCRLCLTSDGVMSDIFLFSPQLGENINYVIMKCAPVKITANDGLPQFICHLCHDQLKKANNFQLLIVRSERTMRRRLQHLHTSDKSSKPESPEHVVSENLDADNTVKNEPLELITVKSEPLELKDAYFDENNEEETSNEMNVEMPLTCEITPLNDSPTDSNIKALHTDETPSTVDESKTEINYENIKVNIDDTEAAAETSENKECSDEMECSAKSDTEKSVSKKREITKKVTKLKAFLCNVCNKSFTQLHNLKSHKLVHTGEKPYKCDICSMRFSQSNRLYRHKRVHTSEKPYKCNVCNKSFTQSGNLKVHKRMHTGEKPFKCDMCNKCFARSSYLIIHKRTHSSKDSKTTI